MSMAFDGWQEGLRKHLNMEIIDTKESKDSQMNVKTAPAHLQRWNPLMKTECKCLDSNGAEVEK